MPQVAVHRPGWNPPTSAVIICDMWDAHHCTSAARRVAEMSPRMNEVIGRLREQGALIIHAPGDCTAFHGGTRARLRAIQAPRAQAPCPIDWMGWDTESPHGLPATLTDPGPCSCESAEPCCTEVTSYPWTRQIESLEIDDRDAVSDDGQEIYNLLEQRGIDDVIVMGVHTNICVLARSYGIRQLVLMRKRPVLCRDLTDSFHRDPRGHEWGTRAIVAHIERRWCPTVSCEDLERGPPLLVRGAS